jgi:hypothetical protein
MADGTIGGHHAVGKKNIKALWHIHKDQHVAVGAHYVGHDLFSNIKALRHIHKDRHVVIAPSIIKGLSLLLNPISHCPSIVNNVAISLL